MENDRISQVLSAIQSARRLLRWRPAKAHEHLAKRLRLGHLPPGATLGDYEALIHRILRAPDAEVYLFTFHQTFYPTLVYTIAGGLWLVMLDLEGGMETAFLVELPQLYFADPRFERLGLLQELEK